MATVCCYLSFEGTCEEAFNFYQSVFGGEFSYLGRYKDMPSADRPIPEALQDKIMHIGLPISKETMLLGCDMSAELGMKPTVGNNISLSVSAANAEEAGKIFKGLAAGGQVTMPLQQTFWAPMFGMLVDKFGISWMVGCE